MDSQAIDANLILDIAKALHRQFDQRFWAGKPSFHNQDHLDAIWQAASLLFQALSDKDPLNLLSDLNRWNRKHQSALAPAQLPGLVKTAFACHDLGNILLVNDSIQPITLKSSDSKLISRTLLESTLEFLPAYTAKGAEDRSRQAAKILITSINPSLDNQSLQLIDYLISQTEFNGDLDQPFTRFVKVSDQLSTGYFRDAYKAQVGLLHELSQEIEDFEFIPRQFFNFGSTRAGELVPDPKTLETIESIWGREVQTFNGDLSQEKVMAKDWLKVNSL
jgi:hypothetical protein